MIATTISHGTIISIEEIPLTLYSDQQTLFKSQHPKGESESCP